MKFLKPLKGYTRKDKLRYEDIITELVIILYHEKRKKHVNGNGYTT